MNKFITLLIGILLFSNTAFSQQSIDKLSIKSWLKMTSETPSSAVYIDALGQIRSSAIVSSTELSYLDGVTSSIQTQIDGLVSDTAYDATSWNGVLAIAPSKNAVRDQIESMLTVTSGLVSDTAYNATTWDSVTSVAPSKNAVRDQIESMLTSISGKQSTLTNSAGLLSALSDETGTGFSVFSASPTFTGIPLAPTASQGNNSTQLSTTAYVDTGLATKQGTLTNSAGLASALNDETGTGFAVFSASPALTGSPTAPTQTAGDNSTKIANTAYVATAVAAAGGDPTTLPYRSVTSTDTMLSTDYTLCLSGASFTETLLTAVGRTGKIIQIIHCGTHLTQVYTLNTTSGQTIGGYASGAYALYTNNETLTLQSDGSNWIILDHKAETPWVDAGPAVGFYTCTVTSANATLLATYTNNGNTYTVTKTIAAQTTLVLKGPASTTASGTLTKASGTGDATITFSSCTGNPFLITATTTSPTFNGTVTSNSSSWRRIGSHFQHRVRFYWTVAGNAGTGDYLWPSPVTIDSSVAPLDTTGTAGVNQEVSAVSVDAMGSFPISGFCSANGVVGFDVHTVSPYTTTSYRIWGFYSGQGELVPISSSFMHGGISSVAYNWTVTLPGLGFKP